jgi:hypothetical protein
MFLFSILKPYFKMERTDLAAYPVFSGNRSRNPTMKIGCVNSIISWYTILHSKIRAGVGFDQCPVISSAIIKLGDEYDWQRVRLRKTAILLHRMKILIDWIRNPSNA